MTLSASMLALAASAAQADDRAVLIEGSPVAQDRAPATATRLAAGPARVVPLTTRFVLNGESLTYGQGPTFGGLSLSGAARDWDVEVSGTHPIRQTLFERSGGGLYMREQTGWYFQTRNVDRQRDIRVTRREAVDIYGFQLDLSITGGCFFPAADPGSYCTYTPSVEIDPDSVDPGSLVPGAFLFGEDVGAEISAATHEALKAEGFQRGLPGGDETVGLSLTVPNSGYVASEARSGLNSVQRHEQVDKRALGGIYRFHQTLNSNAEGASLARTTRGFVFLDASEWTGKAAAAQLLSWILPSARAPLAPTEAEARLSIGNNLFLAANNTRLPDNSFTAYHAGRGHVAHADGPVRRPSEAPRSVFNSFWIGFSPVRDITTGASSSLLRTGPRETTLEGGYTFTQGGIGTPLTESTSVLFLDEISQRISQIELANIEDLFIQSGIDLTRQDALAIYDTTEQSRYRYVPHLSFSGNLTTGTSVTRYYAGVLLDDKNNAYVGFDHSYAGENGLSLFLRAEHYSRPDRDYFSNVEARLSKAFTLSNGDRMTFGVGARGDLDRAPPTDQSVALNDNDQTLELAASYQTQGGHTYGLSHRLVRTEDGSRDESTSIGFSYRVSDSWSFSSQVTPFSEEDAYVAARAGFSWRQADRPGAPTLGVQWASIRYDYGRDQFGNSLRDREDTLLVSYRMKF